MRRLMLLVLLVALALGLSSRTSAAAATITVTTAQDVVADDGKCSLREAVIAANTDAAKGGCPAGSGADVIRFDVALPSLQITLQPPAGPDDDGGLVGDLDLTGAALIEGRPGLILDGAGATNLLDVQPSARIELHDIEFHNGGTVTGDAISVRASGWLTMTAATVRDSPMTGIGVQGRLALSNSTLVGNRYSLDVGGGQAQVKGTTVQGGVGVGVQVHDGGALTVESGRITATGAGLANYAGSVQLRAMMIDASTDGPGLYNQGTLSLTECVVTNNRVGGGLNNTGNAARATILRSRFSQNADGGTGGGLFNTGTATIEASTFDGNSARSGGAIYHNGASLKLTNVTLAGNTATDNGGGIYAMRETTLNYVTLAGNTAGVGGNLFVDEAQVAIAGSLFAREGAKENCSISAGGLNLLGGNLADDTSCAPMPGAANLLLGPLAFNGGATPTRALLTGSPAIDAGASAFCPATDQRGVKRPQGLACDAGAYEAGGSFSRLLLPFVAR